MLAKRILLPPAPTPFQTLQIGRLASRLSIASILLLFAAGGILLYFVNEENGKKEAACLSKV